MKIYEIWFEDIGIQITINEYTYIHTYTLNNSNQEMNNSFSLKH